MALASGSRASLSYVAETAHGTQPTLPTMKELRATSRNINPTANTLVSAEIGSKRQIKSITPGFTQVGGSIGFELNRTSFADMLAAALGTTFTADLGGGDGGVNIQTAKIGTTLTTFTMERLFPDIAQYQVFNGVAINTMAMSIKPEAFAMGTLNFIGMKANAMSATSLGTPTAATTDEPFAAFTGTVTEGGIEIAICTGVDFTLDNGRKLSAVIGSRYSPDVFEGQAKITGQMTAFFEDETLYNKFINNTSSALVIKLLDGSAGYMKFTIPALRYTGASFDPPQEGPIEGTFPFEAYYDATSATSLQIDYTPTA